MNDVTTSKKRGRQVREKNLVNRKTLLLRTFNLEEIVLILQNKTKNTKTKFVSANAIDDESVLRERKLFVSTAM